MEENEVDDINADARAAYEAITARDSEPAAEPVEQVVEAVEQQPEEPTHESEHDESDKPVDEASVEAAKTEADKPKAIKAPQRWDPVNRIEFDKLPEAVKSEIHKTEAAIQKTLKDTKSERDFAQSIWNEVAPYKQELDANGVHPARLLKEYLNIENTLRRGNEAAKTQLVARVLRANNISPQQVIAAMNGGQAMPPAPPPELKPVYDELNVLRNERVQREQQQAQRVHSEAVQALEQSGVKNEPYYEDVRVQMSNFITSGQANSFRDAYDMAVWANPKTRAALQASKPITTPTVTTAQKLSAANSVKGSGPALGSTAKVKQYATVEEAARAAYNKIVGKS